MITGIRTALSTGFRQNFWVGLLPFLFLPNDFLGALGASTMGKIQLMDVILVLTGIFWLLPFLLKEKKMKSLTRKTFWFFLYTLLTVILIKFKFDYVSDFKFRFSLFKFFKFGLYILFGLAVINSFKADDYPQYRQNILKIIVLICLVVFYNFSVGNLGELSRTRDYFNEYDFLSYSSPNVIATALAIFGASCIPYLFTKMNKWKTSIILLIFLALFLSGGRGALFAFLFALGFYAVRYLNLSSKIRILFIGVLALSLLYIFVPEVQFQVDRTLFPDQNFLSEHNAGVLGFDDGKRISGVIWSFPKWLDRPFFGYGFFHRGGLSNLESWGSHNFYLQMLLELGAVGVLLLIIDIREVNKGIRRVRFEGFVEPSKSMQVALMAAFIGGLSGEYYYGSEALMALLIVIAPVAMTQSSDT